MKPQPEKKMSGAKDFWVKASIVWRVVFNSFNLGCPRERGGEPGGVGCQGGQGRPLHPPHHLLYQCGHLSHQLALEIVSDL